MYIYGRIKETTKKAAKGVIFIKTMNLILIIIGVCLGAFTLEMIHLFYLYQTVPDTLITCVFAALGGECGIMGWIKTTKDKYREREWQNEENKGEKIAGLSIEELKKARGD